MDSYGIGNAQYMVFQRVAENWVVAHVPRDREEEFRHDIFKKLDEGGYLYESNMPMLKLEEVQNEGVFGAAYERA